MQERAQLLLMGQWRQSAKRGELPEKMALVEEIEPGNRTLLEYQHMRGGAIIELRRIRTSAELDLRQHGLSSRERKYVADQLNLIALVESEFEATDDMTN
jgi:hypothetical protein